MKFGNTAVKINAIKEAVAAGNDTLRTICTYLRDRGYSPVKERDISMFIYYNMKHQHIRVEEKFSETRPSVTLGNRYLPL